MKHNLINSSLFVKDYSDESSSTPYTESDNISYEKLSHKDDIYLIRTDNGSYELHRKILIKTLHELHKHAHELISHLDKDESDMLASTIEVTKILHNSKALKELMLNDIKHIFSDIKNPIPGTVGAFFIGCFNDNFNGNIALGCNLACAASIFGCNSDIECTDLMLLFTNNTFTSLNDKKSLHAYIHIESENFTAFTNHQINLLKSAGLETVTLIFGNKDSSYKEYTKKIFLDNLVTINSSVTSSSSSSSATPLIIFIIVIVIILIIIGLYYMYKNNYNFLQI